MKNSTPSPHQMAHDLRTSNALLQMKPEFDHGHLTVDSAVASPEIENQRLKSIPVFKVQTREEESLHHNELKELTITFVNHILSKEWGESQNIIFAEAVALHGRTYTRSGISSIISFFQACHVKLTLNEFMIHNIHVDLENYKAAVRGDMVYCATHPGMECEVTEGPCILHFELASGGWSIVQMEIPGL